MNFTNIYITIVIFIGVILSAFGLFSIYKASKIKIEKSTLKEQLQKEIQQLYQSKTELDKALNDEKRKLDKIYETEKNKISEQLKIFQQNADFASTQYFEEIEDAYDEAEARYKDKVTDLQYQEQQTQEKIKDAESRYNVLIDQINAATKAQLRDREKEQKLDFYKLSISDTDLEDIQKLESIKLMLHNPTVLNKLIWSTYFQKQTTEMCNRVLGTTAKVCGIYKITNLKTKQCYIGQSVDVAQRWKDHCKCGLGIDSWASNKLYKSMEADGLWNFTFELMEQCPRESLNEAERRWIEIYQADKYGLNGTIGNK